MSSITQHKASHTDFYTPVKTHSRVRRSDTVLHRPRAQQHNNHMVRRLNITQVLFLQELQPVSRELNFDVQNLSAQGTQANMTVAGSPNAGNQGNQMEQQLLLVNRITAARNIAFENRSDEEPTHPRRVPMAHSFHQGNMNAVVQTPAQVPAQAPAQVPAQAVTPIGNFAQQQTPVVPGRRRVMALFLPTE